MTSIARRLDDDRRRLVVVTSRPLIAQVAYLLLDLHEGDVGRRYVARLSHTTIAHLLGARWQSVTRVVRELRPGADPDRVRRGRAAGPRRSSPGLSVGLLIMTC